MNKEPRILRVGGTYKVYAPNGEVAAIFHNPQFLRIMLEKVFNIDVFRSIEIVAALEERGAIHTPTVLGGRAEVGCFFHQTSDKPCRRCSECREHYS
jgi:hypothetical protein